MSPPLLGPDRFLILVTQLAKQASLAKPNAPGSWQGVEACLFAIRCMGKEIPTNEESVVPRIIEMLPRLPGSSHLRYTASLIVGK